MVSCNTPCVKNYHIHSYLSYRKQVLQSMGLLNTLGTIYGLSLSTPFLIRTSTITKSSSSLCGSLIKHFALYESLTYTNRLQMLIPANPINTIPRKIPGFVGAATSWASKVARDTSVRALSFNANFEAPALDKLTVSGPA